MLRMGLYISSSNRYSNLVALFSRPLSFVGRGRHHYIHSTHIVIQEPFQVAEVWMNGFSVPPKVLTNFSYQS